MLTTFLKYTYMFNLILQQIPQSFKNIKTEWLEDTRLPDFEYFHRVIDPHKRQIFDVAYPNMKEIVENVYYNIPPDARTEHFLVIKDRRKKVENIFKLKCNGTYNLEMV